VSNSALAGGNQLYVTAAEAFFTGLAILFVGAGFGAAGSAFAVRRFLRV
jgi:hypothetical protein